MDKQRENGALLIAASIVAAIRLRGEPIARTPKVLCTVSASGFGHLLWILFPIIDLGDGVVEVRARFFVGGGGGCGAAGPRARSLSFWRAIARAKHRYAYNPEYPVPAAGGNFGGGGNPPTLTGAAMGPGQPGQNGYALLTW
jgi:hypothetical protein